MMEQPNNRNVEFLNKIYQNAKMGGESISYLSQKINDPALRGDLQTQHEQYMNLTTKATQALSQRNALPKENSVMEQAQVWGGVQMNTLLDKTPDHIAEMMIQGSMMGVIDMTRNLKQYADTEGDVKGLGEELVKIEEDNIQRMKTYIQ